MDMFGADTPENARFRAGVRAWIAANLPDDLRGLATRPPVGRAMWWHRRLHEGGLAALHWPPEHGGAGAPLDRQIILREELARADAPEISAQGLHHIGPILIAFGTEAQKRRFLPPILAGDELWCQGYSEPGAGSDLAGLATRARRDGEALVLEGSKIWTTWAHHADWMFALVRTADAGPGRRRDGIGFVLVDLSSPGVAVHPIRTIAGDDEFAQVFLDGVRVPPGNVVGGAGDGWRIATAVLERERLMTASPQLLHQALARARRLAARTGALSDAGFRERLAAAEIEAAAAAAMFAQAAAMVEAGRPARAEASLVKIVSTELLQRATDLLLEAEGAGGALAGGEAATAWLQVRRATIYGGTSQIQRDIVARGLLGAPQARPQDSSAVSGL